MRSIVKVRTPPQPSFVTTKSISFLETLSGGSLNTNFLPVEANTPGSVSRFNCWEPILFYGCKNTDRAHDTFDFPIGFQKETGDHPCPKPFKFWVELLSCYSDDGATVYEPFLGSGTTLMAAQKTGRICFALEHSPHYVDIAVARWERATGQTAVRID